MTVAIGTVIFGAAVGYSEEQISPFLTSLRRSGYQGDVVLIAEPPMARAFAERPVFAGVTFIEAWQWAPIRFGLWQRYRTLTGVLIWYPIQTFLWGLLRLLGWLPMSPTRRLQGQMRLAAHIYPPHEYRFLHYYRFLQHTAYSRVLLTDVRDVLFQDDPFHYLPLTGLAVSIETRQNTILTEAQNAAWVRLIYGAAVLKQIGNCPVACSGVTYGDRDSMLRYLALMGRGVLTLNLRATLRSMLDQGIHNALLWTQQCGTFHCLETLASPVASLHGVQEAQLRMSEDGKLLNRDGSVISVVHQYDRLPTLRAALLARLAPAARPGS